MAKVLENYISDRKIARGLPLAALRDTTIGIDAEYFYTQLTAANGKKEPLLHALGGIPFSLKSMIEAFLSALSVAGIKPLFVFKGVQVSKAESDAPFARPDPRQLKRAEAWEAYDKAKGDVAVSIFNEIETIPLTDVARYVQKILQDNNVTYIVAPYYPWAQLAYLLKHEKQYIDAIYGPHEVLMYDIDRVITAIDIAGGGFSYLNKKALLGEFGNLSNDQFIDFCVLCGLDFSIPFPLLNVGHINNASVVRSARDLLRNFGTGYTVVTTYAENPAVKDVDYVEVYRRTFCAVKFHVIFTDKGHAEPITTDNAPNDIHEFISQRLPEELYMYLFKGMVGPEVLNVITSGKLLESVPLDGGESLEYRRFLTEQVPMWTQILSLSSQPLHRFYQAKRMNAVYWYDRAVEHEIPHRLTPTVYETVNTWHVSESVFQPKVDELKLKTGLGFAISSLSDAKFAAATVSEGVLPHRTTSVNLFTKEDELLLNSYWRFLQLRGFVTKEHTLSATGRALYAGLKTVQFEEKFVAPLLIGLDLIKFKALTARPYTPSYTGLPMRGTKEEKAHILLVSRVAALIPINHEPVGFSGPLSRNLLSFGSFVRKCTSNSRALLEALLFSLLANGEADRLGGLNWAKLGTSLPYQCNPNCGLGIAMKTYLDELSGKPDSTDKEEQERMRAELRRQFAHSIDVVGDMNEAFRLWDAIVVAVKAAVAEGLVSAADGQEFLDADAWVQQRR
ncbi:temperature dependent protein affecting M2 dsRNA replication-domain-containing protein [Limtongia smithiae]|uniref:temperature dependent protein affecting M2 dsRNA replication-domain-containing protein n=1 Tax=Limtongia smithiae TaxID=1125753 RepID=UPI0034CFC589